MMFECIDKIYPSVSIDTVTGSICSFNDEYGGLPLKSHKIALTATQSGSGTPSPDNVRTINGYSTIGISATGKNLFDKDSVTLGKWISNLNTEIPSVTGSYSDYIPIVSNIPYYFSHIAGVGAFYSMCVYDENKTFLENINIQGGSDTSGTVTFTQGAYIRVNVYQTNLDICQVELGSIATAYEPYNGTYTTIQIGSTVYGGEYDARTGVLMVTHGVVDLGSLTWLFNAANSVLAPIETKLLGSSNILSDRLQVVPSSTSASNMPDNSIKADATSQNVIVKKEEINEENAQEMLAGYKLVYELATPTTIQLPPCLIDTLEGVNNIFCDTGDTTVEYIKIV